jgi:type IV secretion system protein VirD4
MAGELGAVINRNASSSSGKGDEFFSKAGDMLAKGLIQLAKGTPYPDMAMVYAILKLPSLVQRLDYAVQKGTIDPWVASSLSQFVGAKDAEKTIAGIQTTAAATFSGFIQADLLPAFLGLSNIPKRIEGKKLIVFKLDDERRTMVGPLLAAALHLCVVANLATPRKDPIAIFIDELPSIRLDKLVTWVNEYRSNGGCFMLGIQSLNQLYEAYGDKLGASIASACSTHVLFNPNDTKTAEEYSKRFGDKKMKLKNRSTSNSSGQSSSRSTSWSESLQKMPLFTVDQILRLSEGQCIITNPGYKQGTEGGIPFPTKVGIPPADIKRARESEQLWASHVRPALDKKTNQAAAVPEYLTEELQKRIDYAEMLLPIPPDEDEEEEALEPVTAGVQPPPAPTYHNESLEAIAQIDMDRFET